MKVFYNCSTTLVRGVSAELEAENWRLCSTTLVRGVWSWKLGTGDFVAQRRPCTGGVVLVKSPERVRLTEGHEGRMVERTGALL